jgi:hypothetical protein
MKRNPLVAQSMHELKQKTLNFRYKGKPLERVGRKATCLESQDYGRGAAAENNAMNPLGAVTCHWRVFFPPRH